MDLTTAGKAKKQEPVKVIEILDEEEQKRLIKSMKRKINTTGKVGNFSAGILLLIASIYFLTSYMRGTLPALPPLSPLVSTLILFTSLICSSFLSLRPSSIPFSINHLETGGPSMCISLLALTSPSVAGPVQKLIWAVPTMLIVVAYEMRRDIETLLKEVAELERKVYDSPTA